MAQLTSTLTLASADVSSDALSFSVTDTANVNAPIENVARITATTTGNASIILPSVNATRYVYIKHLGLNSAGARNVTDKLKVEYSDGNHIAELRAGEFLFLPYDTGGSALLQLEASANTIQAEYAFFTRT